MTERPVIDPAAIQRLRDWGGPTLPRKLIDIFLSHTPERLNQVREGLETGVAQMAEAGAHSMKSSAGNVGAVVLQHLSERAEDLARDGKLEDLTRLFSELERSFHAACEELKAMMERMDE